MLAFGADVGLGRFDQILQPSLRRRRQTPEFAGSHRNSEFCGPACHLKPFGDALIASIGAANLLIATQEIGCRCQIMHVGSGDHDRVDQT